MSEKTGDPEIDPEGVEQLRKELESGREGAEPLRRPEQARREAALRRHWRTTSERLRPHRSKIPLIGITPPLLLAAYSMTQPWAKARVFAVMGISKSPEAALLVIMTLAAMVGASVAATMRGDRLRIAAVVHFVTGVLMCGVALAAYQMVLHAGKKLLGIPLASVHPGPGLRLFGAAAAVVLLLGGAELIVAAVRAKNARAALKATVNA